MSEQKVKKVVAIGGLEFEIEKSVTRPVMKIEKDGQPEYFHATALIHVAPQTEAGAAKKDANGVALPPPMLMEVTDLRDGEEKVVVVNTVLQKNLEEVYPDGGYVGKFFQVTKFAPKGDKRYATFDIKEIKPKAKTAETKTETTAGSTVAEGGKVAAKK